MLETLLIRCWNCRTHRDIPHRSRWLEPMLAIYILDIRIWMAIGTRLVWGTNRYMYIYLIQSKHTRIYICIFSYWIICSSHRHNGSPLARSPSPRRRGHQYIHHDIGFSDTVSNVVEMVKETRHPRHGNSHPRYPRGIYSKFIHSPITLCSYECMYVL